MAVAGLFVATVSFAGVGVQNPNNENGAMVKDTLPPTQQSQMDTTKKKTLEKANDQQNPTFKADTSKKESTKPQMKKQDTKEEGDMWK